MTLEGFLTLLFDKISSNSSLIVLLISLLNLILALKVFKFNQGNSVAKVSVIPVQKLMKDQGEVHYINPTNDNNFYYDDFNNYRYGKRGYPIKSFKHEEIHWYFEVNNKSDLPAINVVINFSLKIPFQWFWGTKHNENIEELGDRLTDEKELFDEIRIDYLAPEETKKVFITRLFGAFSYADLYLNTLKSSERVFIKKPVKVDTYVHPALNISNHEYEKVNLYASFGLNNYEMKKFLSPKEYDYFLKNNKEEVDNK